MPDRAEQVGVVATFFKNARGRLTMDSVVVVDEYGCPAFYDVEYSKKYGYLYHMSGFGGTSVIDVQGLYAATDDVMVRECPSTLADEATRARNATRRLRRLPKHCRPRADHGESDLFDWIEKHGINDDAVWCSTCRDWVPGHSLCKHTWWCDVTGWYSTPDEPCGCESREKCRDA